MSQPTENQRPDWATALDRMGSLTPEQWDNLGAIAQLQKDQIDRLIRQAQKVPLRDRLHETVRNATARVHAVYHQTRHRLSEMAQQLQSQASQYAQAGREWVGQQVQSGREWAGQQVDAGREWTGRQVEAGRAWGERQVEAGRQWVDQQRDRAAELGQQAVGTYQAGVEAAGRGLQAGREWAGEQAQAGREWVGEQAQAGREWVGQQRERAAELGGKAMDAGRGVAERASRWFQTQKTRASIATEGARATIAAMKFDPTVPQNTSTMDLTELSQQYSKVLSAPTLEDRLQALQGIVANTQAKLDAETAARALGGVAPPGQSTPQAQPTQQPTEPAKTTLQKTETKGITKS